MSKNFSLSYGDLLQRGDHLVSLLTRDEQQFASLGFDETYRQSLVDKLEYFRNLNSDDYWQGQQMLMTDAKNKLATQLKDKISDLRFRCKLTFGEKSVQYRSMRFSKLRDINAGELFIYAKHVVDTATKLLPELEEKQVNETMLAAITATASELDKAIDEQKDMISTREDKTFEREEKGNEIYSVISEICEVGKRLWDGINQAHYNDYLLYGSPDPLVEEFEEEEELPGGPVAP